MSARRWIGAAVVVLGSLTATTREARADIQLAGNIDVGVPLDGGTHGFMSTGAGFDVRLGYRFTIPYQHIAITPELVGGYADLSAHFVRVRPGLKLGFGRIFVPYVFGHVGWGWTTYDASMSPSKSVAIPVNAQGAAFDVGAGLDLTITRRFTVGAHIGYNAVHIGQTDSASRATLAGPVGLWPKWMSFGLNATLYL